MNEDVDRGTSVLLPVFWRESSENAIAMLTRAIESVEEQVFPGPHEILLIDDGSPTPVESVRSRIGSDQLLKSVRFIRTSRNNGLVNALNVGLNKSRYSFIARIDADDRWLPSKIEKQFALFDADPELTITATGMSLVDTSGKFIEAHVRPGDWSGILRFFIEGGCPFPHGSILARREIFHLVGGYSHDPITAHCEDYALWGTWLRFFKAAMVEETLYDYTISESSVSSVYRAQQQRASGIVNARFRAIDPVLRVPTALTALASIIGVTVREAGMLSYLMWAFRLNVWLPAETHAALRALMPDRIVTPNPDEDDSALDIEQILHRDPSVRGRDLVCMQVL